jgi:hypothetical protein
MIRNPDTADQALNRRQLVVRRYPATKQELNVIEEIHPEDDMYLTGDLDAYFESGRSALECIDLAMRAAGKEDVSNVLDFASGFGRCLRTLSEAFPHAQFTACDLDRAAVDFCAQTFGARPIYSAYEPDEVSFDATYDLIWCGSFFTHLDARRFAGFLSLFESLLQNDGLFVFTVLGAGHERRVVKERQVERGEVQMFRSYDAEGYGYYNYPGQNFGDAMASPSWVTNQLDRLQNLRLVTYSTRRWHAYQDLVACVRTAT